MAEIVERTGIVGIKMIGMYLSRHSKLYNTLIIFETNLNCFIWWASDKCVNNLCLFLNSWPHPSWSHYNTISTTNINNKGAWPLPYKDVNLCVSLSDVLSLPIMSRHDHTPSRDNYMYDKGHVTKEQIMWQNIHVHVFSRILLITKNVVLM